MASNTTYMRPDQLPDALPLFPLPGALLLPRGQIPLNIFEPRYIQMIDVALGASRLIGMIQPEPESISKLGSPSLYTVGCAGRITQFSETGDGRYLVQLTGICRFRVLEELKPDTGFRQARVAFAPFQNDLEPGLGEAEVDRDGLIGALKAFSDANSIQIDWSGVEQAPNEALVNALSMMSPYGVREKQALLEAETLKARAEMLVAITEIELARDASDGSARMN